MCWKLGSPYGNAESWWHLEELGPSKITGGTALGRKYFWNNGLNLTRGATPPIQAFSVFIGTLSLVHVSAMMPSTRM